MNKYVAYVKSKNDAVFEKITLVSKLQTAVILNKITFFYKSHVQPLSMRLFLRDQILLIKQLGILIRAGVPLLSALVMLKKQSKGKTLNKIMDQVIYDVNNGQYLSTALSKFKNIFGELIINIIAIG